MSEPQRRHDSMYRITEMFSQDYERLPDEVDEAIVVAYQLAEEEGLATKSMYFQEWLDLAVEFLLGDAVELQVERQRDSTR